MKWFFYLLLVITSVPALAGVAINPEKYNCSTLQEELEKKGSLEFWRPLLIGYGIFEHTLTPNCRPGERVEDGNVRAKDDENCKVGYWCYDPNWI